MSLNALSRQLEYGLNQTILGKTIGFPCDDFQFHASLRNAYLFLKTKG